MGSPARAGGSRRWFDSNHVSKAIQVDGRRRGSAPVRFDGPTAAQLKSYLDGFQTGSGGWTLGSTPAQIGLQFAIPNDAAGLAGDLGMRHFFMHQDASSVMNAFVPEPDTLVMGALGMVLLGVVLRRKRRFLASPDVAQQHRPTYPDSEPGTVAAPYGSCGNSKSPRASATARSNL